MAKKPETLFKEKVMLTLRNLPYSWWEKIQQAAIRGTPDIIGCVAGTFVAIELKKDKNAKPDELQRWKLDQIDRAGGVAMVVHPGNWDRMYNRLLKLAGGKNGI